MAEFGLTHAGTDYPAFCNVRKEGEDEFVLRVRSKRDALGYSGAQAEIQLTRKEAIELFNGLYRLIYKED